MLFVAEYEFGWDALSSVVAKRLEWNAVQPEGFRFIGEYVWQDRDPPFRGVAVIEVEDVAALNAFALHYGPSLKMGLRAATDVASGIAMISHEAGGHPASRPARRHAGARARGRRR